MSIEVIKADLSKESHALAIVEMTNEYARDPMGSGCDLPEAVTNELVNSMKRHPTTIVFLAMDGGRAVGIANCFLGFSTFAAKPLLNIHDLSVHPEYRNQGIARLLIASAEREAAERGCCKLTLEVLDRNEVAKRVYTKAGFQGAEDNADRKLFLTKEL